MWIVELLQDKTIFHRKYSNKIFAITQDNFADTNFACLLHYLTQQGVGLFRYGTIRPGIVGSIVKSSGNFGTVNKADDVDCLRGFDLNLGYVFGLDNRITIRFVLVALSDLVVGNDLATFLAALIVTNRTIVFAV